MKELDIQIAEFTFPFPAKIFEAELNVRLIPFRQFQKESAEGSGSVVFYINNSDFKEVIKLKNKVERENAKSEIEHLHPIRKPLAVIALLLIIIYVIIELSELF